MFSVIIPVHNKAPHLNRSINSVLNQTFLEFELILINDASTDGSMKILESYSDPRIRLLERSTPGPGGYAARNLGIQTAKFKWISFLDADDAWEIDYLENVAKVLAQKPKVNIISTNWDNYYEDKIIPNKYFDKFKSQYINFGLKNFFEENYFIWTSALTVRKSIIMEAGLFPEDRCKRGGDVDTWIRCLDISGNDNIWINKKLAHYYKETVNRVTDNSSNPVTDICAVASIESLRLKIKDKELLRSIDKFLAKIIYHKMISDFRRGKKYHFNDLKLIHDISIKTKTLIKYLLRVTFFEKNG